MAATPGVRYLILLKELAKLVRELTFRHYVGEEMGFKWRECRSCHCRSLSDEPEDKRTHYPNCKLVKLLAKVPK